MTTKELGFTEKAEVASTLAATAMAVVVDSPQSHKEAGALVEAIRALEKELEAEYKAHPVIVQAKKIQAAKGEMAEMLETARKTAKGRQIAWEDAEEQKRRAEEARLAAEAKKKQEDEAIAAAKKAQEAGNKDEAIATLEAAIAAPAPVVVLPKVAPATKNRRKVFKFKVTNEAVLPRQYLKADEVKIGGVVRSLGEAANIPGVEVWSEFV